MKNLKNISYFTANGDYDSLVDCMIVTMDDEEICVTTPYIDGQNELDSSWSLFVDLMNAIHPNESAKSLAESYTINGIPAIEYIEYIEYIEHI